jgi:hypothetical protein
MPQQLRETGRRGALRRHRTTGLPRVAAILVAFATLAVGLPSRAQEAAPPAPPRGAPALAPEQLDSLVAPVALYPDELLSQVLAASTYPLEVVQAARWLKQNPGLQGEALTQAARGQPWDPSVQALVVFPDVLNRLDENLTWTTDLGNAFLDQQQDVMEAVQRMRREAQDRGALASNQAETVTTTTTDTGQPLVDIEPTDPEVLYVPTYDPAAIWGSAYYPYPVLYYPPAAVIVFSYGFVMPRYYHDWRGWRGWGWGWNWREHSPVVNNSFFYRYRYRPGGFISHDARTSPWVHDPGHRAGVPYGPVTSSRFGAPPRSAVPAPALGGARPVPPSRLPEARPGQPHERIGSRDATPLYSPRDRSAFGVDTRDRAEIDSSRGRASMYGSRTLQPAPAPARTSAPPLRPSPPPVRLSPAPARSVPPPHR